MADHLDDTVGAGRGTRLFAWPYNFRCVVVRWEYHIQNFRGMVQLACIIILLRFF